MFGEPMPFVPVDDSGQEIPRSDWPQERAARGDSFTMPFALQGPGDTYRWFEASGQPLQLDGDHHGGVVVIRDVTDRSLRRLQEQFLAVAGHELRTPLTALSLALDLATKRVESLADERLAGHVSRAKQETRRLNDPVRELVDVVRLQSAMPQLQRAPADLVTIVRAAIETARLVSGDMPFVVTTSREPIIANVDARRIEQAVLNLLVNAANFAQESDHVNIRLRRAGGEAVIEVQDFGPGIAPEVLPHVFERFYQAEGGSAAREGLGLGLYIAREIVNAHGGSLEATSRRGEGATFVVRLPLDAQSVGSPAPGIQAR
jgi:two-component system CheB/CheR fusion protein